MTCEACRTFPPIITEGYTPKGESTGADILAARLNALVLIPDFFDGDGVKPEWFPTDTEERHGLLMDFVARRANWTEAAERIPGLVAAYQGVFPGVLALSSGEGSILGGTVQIHPGLMDKADAEALTIPHAILASKEEPVDIAQAYKEIIAARGFGGVVETYASMWHGWMGARADLKGEESKREYIRGRYEQIAGFFEQYLSD
ncbi:hypothetical protein BJX63DRAFT_425693 [Aspergillus granulosus]|uniref:Dienelactone hydrolase domain-containing protein n=1 Tax=Aspergillus granulosus TaxID=176169 RepID=A0ABR4GVF4_9EURO